MSRASSRVAAWALLGLLAGMSPGAAEEPSPADPEPCSPRLEALSVDGGDPARYAPPSGFTGNGSIQVRVEVSHKGESCAQALNSPPTLSAGWVDPLQGPATSTYKYRVTYLDADGDAPETITARIDGETTINLTSSISSPDFRTGVVFVGQLPFRPILGPHAYAFEASDGVDAVSTAPTAGPRVIDAPTGTVDVPNPANRLLIHPIANGPTFVPSTEIPPPILPLLGSPQQGVLSYVFPIDPEAADGSWEYTVNQVGALDALRDGSLEQDPDIIGTDQLVASAVPTDAARTGSRAADLAPGGAVPEATGLLGGLDFALRPDLPLAQASRFDFWYQHEETASAASLFGESLAAWVLVEVDIDRDGGGDACLVNQAATSAATEWTLHRITPSSPFEVRDAACANTVPMVDPLDGATSLADLQNDPLLGLARITSVQIQTRLAPGEADAWPEGNSFLVDDATFRLVAQSDADFDACFYPAALDGGPLSCISDFGPHQGALPERTARVNVWADSLLPSGLVPQRPYVEPASFMFTYQRRGQAPASASGATTTTGFLMAGDDVDGDGTLGATEPVLARVDGIAATETSQSFDLDIAFDASVDRAVALAFRYENGIDPDRPGLATTVADVSYTFQHFVNDSPSAHLEGEPAKPEKKKIEFQVGATDPDDTQGTTAAGLGGIRSWRLDFGDGSEVVEGTSASANIVHKYNRGTYTATFEVLDGQGASSAASLTVDVPDDE